MQARWFRYALLVSVLLWGALFGAVQAFACTWTVTAATDAGDIGYVYSYSGLASGFCAGPGSAWAGLSSGVTCSAASNVVTGGGTFNSSGLPWAYTIVGSGAGCVPDDEPPDDTPPEWAGDELLKALLGCGLFFAFMHGFGVGRQL